MIAQSIVRGRLTLSRRESVIAKRAGAVPVSERRVRVNWTLVSIVLFAIAALFDGAPAAVRPMCRLGIVQRVAAACRLAGRLPATAGVKRWQAPYSEVSSDSMATGRTLRPGERGTKRLVAKYGERLVRVRYRADAASRRRYKTVEIIEEELPWLEPDPDEVVKVRVAYEERAIRRRVKEAGGWWSREERAWKLPRYRAEMLGLGDRIVAG